MRYLSLFSGIEAATVAWRPLGWECVAVSEIEPFQNAVLQHHYPDVPNLGDVTKVTDAQLSDVGPINLVVGGFPCQDVSVAGKRAGLEKDGERTRSGLFWEAVRLVRASGARWAVLENVPGLFTSNDGRDFGVVVGALVGCEFDVPDGGWPNAGVAAGPLGSVEWAVLDAQFFGLPQRRKRVFLVFDSGDWASRPPVLLEPESLRGDSEPRRPVREEDASGLPRRDGAGGGEPVPAAPTRGFGHQEGRSFRVTDESTSALTTSQGLAVQHGGRLRRMTAMEYARHQGFPDDYLDIKFKGKPATDAVKHFALGNSMAVPVMRWIGERIAAVDAIPDV